MLGKNFINLTEKQKKGFIYRTTTFSRLVELFETKKNTLLSPAVWDDPFENFILNATFDLNGEKVKFSAHDKSFAQSWSLKHESDAMWRIYSPDKSCVRIRTSVTKLAQSLSAKCKTHQVSAFIGRVEYHSEKTISEKAKRLAADILDSTGVNFARTLLFKRNSFEHEKEVRLIYFGDHTNRKSQLYKYDVDPHQLIDSIAIDPRAPQQLVDVYKHYLRNKIGFKGHIIKSRLYDLPKELIFELKT